MNAGSTGTDAERNDPLPLSALQHLLFCERQCALIHLEGLWAENRLTVEGRHLHDKAHDGPPRNTRGGMRIARHLALRSERLGVWGYADVVEFRLPGANEPGADSSVIAAPPDCAAARNAPLVPFPVEYKRGRPKVHDADRVQLCGQALCLEEMLNVEVPAGAIFYERTRRRHDVVFEPRLRERTEDAIARLHDLIARGETPVARREKKCDRCSLLHLCLPDAAGKRQTVAGYLDRTLTTLGAGHVPEGTLDGPFADQADPEAAA